MKLRAISSIANSIFILNGCLFLFFRNSIPRKNLFFILFLWNSCTLFSQVQKIPENPNTIDYHLKKSTKLIQLNLDSALLYAEKANRLMTNKTPNKVKYEVYLNLGNINNAQGNYAIALKHYFDAKKLIELDLAKGKNKAAENSNIENLTKIGVSFFYQKNFDQALHYFDEALQNTLKFKNQNSKEVILFKQKIFNNIAAVKIQLKQYDKALEYYQNSLKINAEVGDKNIESSVNNNIGICYMEKKEYTLAQYYLEKSLDIRVALNDFRGIAQCYNNLGKNNALMGNTTIAKENLLKALEIGKKLGNKESKLNSLQSLTQLYQDTHDYQKAYSTLKEAEIIKDSLFNIESAKKIAQLEIQHQFDKQKKVFEIELKRRATEEQKKQLIYLIIALTLVFLLILLSLMVYLQRTKINNTRLQKDKLELEHLNMSLEKQKLAEELEFKNRELTTNVMYLLKKNEFINGITEKLIQSKHNFKAENQKVIQEIINQLKSSSDSAVWLEFETHFTQVHSAFYNKLNDLFPNLSSNEKKLCAFLRLNLSTKDISAITYQSVNSITVARSRLRKKLNIQGEDTNLINFLTQL